MTRQRIASVFVLVIGACAMFSPHRAYSQTLNVIYNFQNSPDGANPQAGVTFDAQGNLYGTAEHGGLLECDGLHGCGMVFQLTPNSGGDWTEHVVTQFPANLSAGSPVAPVVLDRRGNLYSSYACVIDCFGSAGGGIFQVVRGANGTWTTNNLVSFSSGNNECEDGRCGVGFDPAGRLYATSNEYQSGLGNNGAVFYIGQRSITDWYPLNLYSFKGGGDGSGPSMWFTFGQNDTIYGTTSGGGGSDSAGTVFMLQSNGQAQWHETVLYRFQNYPDGAYPYGGVIFGSDGNLYGTTAGGGASDAGTVFKLTHNSNGSWSETVLYSFQVGADASNPSGPVVFDSAGNLWGVGMDGQFGHGAIFKLAPSGGGNWTESVVYSFTGGADGGLPFGALTLDSSGNVYGTTIFGGANPSCSDSPYCGGVVYKLTP